MRILVILLLGYCTAGVSSFSPNGTFQSRRKIMSREAIAEDDDIDLDMADFKARREKVEQKQEFDGYALRDLILKKWGECYDLDFNRVDAFGFREIYLNIYPFKMGGRTKWRHETELDYLMHLQAIVEILESYGQLDNVIYQIQETDKKPKMGAPIKAVPIRLELSKEAINKIMGYK
jgi:Domain of unknown function (DUF3067)